MVSNTLPRKEREYPWPVVWMTVVAYALFFIFAWWAVEGFRLLTTKRTHPTMHYEDSLKELAELSLAGFVLMAALVVLGVDHFWITSSSSPLLFWPAEITFAFCYGILTLQYLRRN